MHSFINKQIETIKKRAKEIDDQMLKITINENNESLVQLNDIDGLKFKEIDTSYYARKTVADKISKINQKLKKLGFGIFVRDAWRSPDKQKNLWEKEIFRLKKLNPNKTLKDIEKIASDFVLPPGLSSHSTGAAVDVQLYNLKTKKVLDFGVDNFRDELCYTSHPKIKETAKVNRKLLIKSFEDEDFCNYLLEYWHFSYGNAEWAAYKNKNIAFYRAVSLSD